MITDVEYMQIVSEAYDLSDYATKKKVLFCNEAKKVDNIEHIVGRLYELIKTNCTGIDFGTIPKSKGSITHIENYSDLFDCVNQIHDMVKNYSESTATVDEISTAIDNIRVRERQFSKAFALNIELPIMIYNISTLAVVSSVSLLLASSVEYIKNGHDSFKVSFDKVGYYKSRDHVLFEYLVLFNNNCANGTIDKLINECVKNNVVTESAEELVEDAVVTEGIISTAKDIYTAARAMDGGLTTSNISTAAGKEVLKGISKLPKPLKVIGIIVGIGIAAVMLIKAMRKVTAWAVKGCIFLSDWFEAQADFLQINAENLKYRDDDKGDEHRRQVYQRQSKWVERFRKISNFLSIKDAKAKKEIYQEERNRDRTYYDDDDEGLF